MRTGVYNVRVWAAPRLESAADYCTTTVAPKVSSTLRSSAKQVRPADVTQKKGHSALTWSVLTAAVLAATGAVAALVKYRYRAAVTTDEEKYEADLGEDGTAAGTEGAGTEGAGAERTMPASSAPGAPGAPGALGNPTTASTDAGVNGRVSQPGW